MQAFLASLLRFLDTQLGGAASLDAGARARHRDFIAARLGTGLVGVVAFPLWLATGGPGGLVGAVTIGWLLAAIPLALGLARTVSPEMAHVANAALMTGMVTWLTAMTGGLASPFAAWFVIIGAETATSGRLRPVAAATALSLLGLTIAAGSGAVLPAAAPAPALAALGNAALLAYGALLAARLVSLQRADRRAAEADIRDSLWAAEAADLIIRHGADLKVEAAGTAARRLLGVPPRLLAGDGLLHRVHLADRPAYLMALREAQRLPQPQTAVLRLRRAAEEGPDAYLRMEMRCRASGDAVVAVLRDIGADWESDAAVQDCPARPGRMQGPFLAQLGHELRTPLNAIIGFSDILRGEGIADLGDERRLEYAQLINGAGHHLLQLVGDFLDLSKIEAGAFRIEPQPFALLPLVEECRALLQAEAARRGVRIVTAVPAGLPDLVADRRACTQIILNLLSNALKASAAEGEIVLAVRRRGGDIVLTVGDHGVGIAAADLPRLGTPFVQAHSAYNRPNEGTGLGLSVVKALVALHGGRLSIRSEIGVGTEVTVALPLAGQPSASALPDAEIHWTDTQERRRA